MNLSKVNGATVSFLFNYLLLAYISKLERIGCDCGLTAHRLAVKSSIIVNFVVIFGYIITDTIPPFTKILIVMSDILFSIYIFVYLYRLKGEKCKCSDGIVRDVYYYYYLINMIIVALLVSLFVLLLIF